MLSTVLITPSNVFGARVPFVNATVSVSYTQDFIEHAGATVTEGIRQRMDAILRAWLVRRAPADNAEWITSMFEFYRSKLTTKVVLFH